jgi:hypothetical protein
MNFHHEIKAVVFVFVRLSVSLISETIKRISIKFCSRKQATL